MLSKVSQTVAAEFQVAVMMEIFIRCKKKIEEGMEEKSK